MPLAELGISEQIYEKHPQASVELCEAALGQVQKHMEVPKHDLEWRIVQNPKVQMVISCTVGKDEYGWGRPFNPQISQIWAALSDIAQIHSPLRLTRLAFEPWQNTAFFMRGQPVIDNPQISDQQRILENNMAVFLSLFVSPDHKMTDPEFTDHTHGILGTVSNILSLPITTSIESRLINTLAAQTDYSLDVDLKPRETKNIFSTDHLEELARSLEEQLGKSPVTSLGSASV